ncbi:fimbria/pilus chaperone family protein [Burkholderia metallica]|uniref:Fimbria/pilus chaperone family protein n=1 Tax=Burkholderia metallica TaxID=488729 RepID=A0ABT8PHT7_9BURK|nr:fimbria/pilus chaperone family protein [Burkholderia metallica]MDN7934680.1 fimbria/pilus chaperone family protein [Burkholderia metallica]
MKRVVSLAISMLLTPCMFVGHAAASGMQPETSIVVLDETEGETTLNVKNTESRPALLHASIEDIPEDPEPLVVLTPPVARVEGGDTQLVRFVSVAQTPVTTQRLKRVLLEGIPQQEAGSAKITVTVRHNLPLIIHPKGLAKHRKPWTLLKWTQHGDTLRVTNDSAYVVRLAQNVRLNPSAQRLELPRPYILSGETLSLTGASPAIQSVTLFPATVYGIAVDSYDAPLVTSRP